MEKLNRTLKNSEKAITLISLVVTIIVLLILAGISISMLSGDNGLLQRTVESKEKTNVAEEKEQIQLEVLGSYENDGTFLIGTVNTNIKNHISGATTDDATEFPLTVTYTKTGNKYEIDKDGKVDVKGPSVTEYVKVGHYINYDPTRGVTDTSKLTYISPTGTATEHGNGYTSSETGGGQKFTAKSTEESGIKWRVLTVSDSKIEIIPDVVIKKDLVSQDSGNFLLKGARGYLYAEQELNEICKIYGYGYGADTSVGSTFKIGGPYSGEETINSISGTGARSITVEDLNKIAGIYKDENDGKLKYSDGTIVYERYGSTVTLTSKVKYPTINSSLGNNTTGISNNSWLQEFKYTWYYYNKSKIIDENVQNMLFNGSYWLSSRSMASAYGGGVGFDVRLVDPYNVTSVQYVFEGKSTGYDEYLGLSCGVRPIVTLKSNVIDISNADESSGQDGHAWTLK